MRVATIKGNSRGNTLAGTDAADVLFGLGGADRLTGGGGEDVLYGDDDLLGENFGSGNDRLDGGLGRDLLVGGAGADRLVGGDGDDLLIGGFASNGVSDGQGFGYGFSPFVDGGNDSYDGGAGFDVAVLSFTRSASIALDISTVAPHAITANGAQIGTIRDVEAITAFLGSGDDVVTGAASGDELHGRGGDDVLSGGGGGDRIDGGAGNDRLSGGDGFDTLSYADATGGVRVDLGLAGQAQATRGAGTDTISGFEQVDGSNFSDRIIGSDAGDFITAGNGGNDRLSGGAGDDQLALYRFASDSPTVSTLSGGEGDDVLTIAAAADATDSISVVGGSGDDAAYLTVSAQQNVDMGSGEDRVVMVLGTGVVAVTLGRGVDTVSFAAFGGLPDGQTPAHVVDFDAGNNGDRVDLRELLSGVAIGYSAGENPFAAGYVRLVASDGGTVLEFDRDGAASGYGFVGILGMDGVAPADFTAFNFGGTNPHPSSFADLPEPASPDWPGLVHLA